MDILRPNCAYPSSPSLLEAAFVVSTLLDAEHPIPHNSLSSARSLFFPGSQSYKIHKPRRKTENKNDAIALRKSKPRRRMQQQKRKKNRDRESFKHRKLFFIQKMQANTTRTLPTKPIMLRNKNRPSLLGNSSSTTELLWKSSTTTTTTRDSSTSFLTKKATLNHLQEQSL
jgi:hypothetical protein